MTILSEPVTEQVTERLRRDTPRSTPVRLVPALMAELERDWLAALEEHERSELVMPRPQVHEPPQRLQADRCDPDAIRKAA